MDHRRRGGDPAGPCRRALVIGSGLGRGADPAALREQMAKNDGLEALRDEIRLSRAVDILISSAKVLPSGEPVEVKSE